MRAILPALLTLFMTVNVSMAAELEKFRIPSLAKDRSHINGYLLRPYGAGPFPAVVALHGCSGLWRRKGGALTSRHADWGNRLRKASYVVLFPDSFGSRGHKSLCKVRKRPVKHSHRVGDIRGAADWLTAQPFIDGGKLALLGWSNGASSLLRSLAPGKAPATTDFKTAIGFYPGCRTVVQKTSWRPRIKPLILMGAADDWTPPRAVQTTCEQMGRTHYPLQRRLSQL